MSQVDTLLLPETGLEANTQRLVRDAPPESCSTVSSPKLRGLLVAMDDGSTSAAPTAEQVRTPEMLFECVQAAEDRIQESEGFEDDELRIYLAGEWYFRKSTGVPKTSLPYTHAEMRTLVDKLCTLSAKPEFASWLILPGTIYFGLGYTTYVAAEPDKTAIKADIKKYFKLPAKGGSAPTRTEPTGGEIVQWLVGNLGIAIYRGDLVHHHFKWIQQDIADHDKINMPKARHIWAMNLLDPTEARAVIGPAGFELPIEGYKARKKVTFVYDICRDHKVGVALGWAADQGTQADIHLVISNGVEINKATIAARAGGHLIQCDGESSSRRLAWKVITPPSLPDKTTHAGYLDDVAVTDAKIAFNTDPFLKWQQGWIKQKAELNQEINKLKAENTNRKCQSEVDQMEKQIQALSKERTKADAEIQKAETAKEKLSKNNKKGKNDKKIEALNQQIGRLRAKDKLLADVQKEQFAASATYKEKNELSGSNGAQIAQKQQELKNLEAEKPRKEKEMVGRADSEAVKEKEYETARKSVKTEPSKELKDDAAVHVTHTGDAAGKSSLVMLWKGRIWIDPQPDVGMV